MDTLSIRRSAVYKVQRLHITPVPEIMTKIPLQHTVKLRRLECVQLSQGFEITWCVTGRAFDRHQQESSDSSFQFRCHGSFFLLLQNCKALLTISFLFFKWKQGFVEQKHRLNPKDSINLNLYCNSFPSRLLTKKPQNPSCLFFVVIRCKTSRR